MFVVSRPLKDTDDWLLAISVRGSSNTIYHQKHLLCSPDKIHDEFHNLLIDTIKYVNENLIKEKGFSIRWLNVIGNVYYLLYNEYSSKRSSGCFYGLSKKIKKDTELHNSCKELYDYIKKNKLKVDFNTWRTNDSGYLWSQDKSIKTELGRLAGDKYYDEDKAFDYFLKYCL
jgi:hypothetical protein